MTVQDTPSGPPPAPAARTSIAEGILVKLPFAICGVIVLTAVLINIGRGPLVVQPDLIAALEAGKIAGAGLDVYEDEPTLRHALTAHPRVVATPHIGAQTREAQERIAIETAHMVLAALDGEVPAAAVNPSVRRPMAPTA